MKRTAKQKERLDLLKALTAIRKMIREADEIDHFRVTLYNEFEEIPLNDWVERRPTGWIALNCTARLCVRRKQ